MDERKIERAIKLLQSIPQDGPIELCYSTGKDSDVILELAKMAQIPFEAIYKNTTCDPRGSIAHAREMGVKIVPPRQNMLQLIEAKGWPSRWTRFCCRELKEYKIHDRAILGIRREESNARAKRYTEPEQCRVYSSKEKVRQYFPILDWTDEDVAEFVKMRGLKLHPHYYDEQGNLDVKRRVGCIGCPLAGQKKEREAYITYPSILKARIKAFCRWFESKKTVKTRELFATPYEAVFFKLFCHDMREFKEKTDGMFGKVQDNEIKRYLEDYFKVTLD